MAETIQRYEPDEHEDHFGFRIPGQCTTQPYGEYVLHADHAAALAAKDEDIERLRGELSAMYQRGVSHGHLECAEQLAVLTAENAALESQLKTVLDREAETQRRHDERLDALTAENAALKKQATLASSERATEAVAWKGMVEQLQQQAERLTSPVSDEEIRAIWEARKSVRGQGLCDYQAIGPVIEAALAARKQEGEPQP
jgi:chromosome segregation ATPase